MPHVKSTDGVRIHYEVYDPPSAKDAPPVVMLQGIGLPGRMWFDIPRDLANDAERPYRAIVIDNRGTGQSDKPKGMYSMKSMAHDVVSVLDELAIPKATVVGFSMGGMIAQQVAIRHTERVTGLVLLATGPGLPYGRLPSAKVLATLTLLGTGRMDPAKAMAQILLPESQRHRVADLFAEWPTVMAETPTPAHGFLGQMGAAFTHAVGHHLPHLDIPAVVFAGRHDVLVPPENSAKIAERLRRRHFELLDEVAHDIMALRPQIVKESLRKLDEVAEARAAGASAVVATHWREHLGRVMAQGIDRIATSMAKA